MDNCESCERSGPTFELHFDSWPPATYHVCGYCLADAQAYAGRFA